VASPDLRAATLPVPATVGITTAPKSYERGYIQSWNLTVQKQLAHGWVVQAGYVGNSGIRLRAASDVNYGQVGGGTASQALVQKFGRTASTSFIQPLGYSRYHSLQTTLSRRFANGFQLNTSYTFSKAIMLCCGDGYDPSPAIKIPQYYALNKALAPNDRTHQFTVTAIQQLPFGPGKPWLNHGGFLAALAGGWQLNALVTRFSGSPFSVAASGTSLNAPGNTQRADQVKSNVAILGGHGPGSPYFDPLAFAQVTDVRFGTAGFDTLRGPGLLNMDLGLFRQVSVNERWKVQVRAEAFNFSNTPNFGNPGANVSNMQLNPDGTVRSLGGYTEITSMNSTSREGLAERTIQFGVRVTF
jgi:hypothetical protein